jgi:hypothetical protein
MQFEHDQNNAVPAPLTPTIRVSWSRARAWHGETVVIRVRCQFVPDGTQLALDVTTAANVAVETIGNLTINAGTKDHNYVLDWKVIAIAAGSEVFNVVGRLPQYPITSAPSALAVDVEPPLFSA